jgi:hypothetical protein
MFDLPKTCIKCGQSYTGLHVCKPLFKSDYDRGFEAGKSFVAGYIPPIDLPKKCFKCGQTYTGIHVCLESFKSDYDRGYDAGKKGARRELGYPGKRGFQHFGE